MKIMTILGTRPEIIRLSMIIPMLDRLCSHLLVHTGQNFDHRLGGVFFDELGLRAPDYVLENTSGTTFAQIGSLLLECERVMLADRPDRLLVLGDTNSALAVVVAKRIGIPVYHMEAGNRCYDDRVPEEVNRRIVDHCSDVLMPYTERSRQNLLREGFAGERIFVVGNPINEVLDHYAAQIDAATVLADLGLAAGEYFLVTMHRSENVDIRERIEKLTEALAQIQEQHRLPIVISTHPHTRKRMQQFGLDVSNPMIRYMPPFGFFDFVALEKNALCVLSDSGTVQEECAILDVPNVTIRDVTERPETLECGSNMLTGASVESIRHCVQTVLQERKGWKIPLEYGITNVSEIVINILLGYRRPALA